MNFTAANRELTDEILNNTNLFIRYINKTLAAHGAVYGIGGYNEHRTIYSRSRVFDSGGGEEPRRLHLGTDIWGKPYTKVMAPLDGIVHSFVFNNAYGDYGATIILTHNLDGTTFYTLYGHLSLNSIKNMHEGDVIRKGDVFCEFGIPFENGQWPPHLHFQVIRDMLENSPDADLILDMMPYAVKG
jgi:murein DD-endopeptidase MepM/ murein hydrolase activator NlpD